jgi:hypothetical protein
MCLSFGPASLLSAGVVQAMNSAGLQTDFDLRLRKGGGLFFAFETLSAIHYFYSQH